MVKTADPVEVVRANLADWDVPHVEKAIFGTSEPDAIVSAVDGFCRQHLGSRIAGYSFQTTSIGSTHGIHLEDGRHVVLKARPPVVDNPELHMDAYGARCAISLDSQRTEWPPNTWPHLLFGAAERLLAPGA